MNVTGIAIVPPAAAKDCPKGTPELLASCFARYSRSNLGIHEIFSKIDWNDSEKSIDSIFKFIDYGHASIGGLTGGIAIAVDGASMLLIYKIFEFAQLVDGQESSTRYIKFGPSSLPDPNLIGIPEHLQSYWYKVMNNAYEIYNDLYIELDTLANEHPEVLGIDSSLPDKVKDRIRKNYALDRCRYYIPSCTVSSGVFIMTARVWSDVLKKLGSLPWPEAIYATEKIRDELRKFAPRLIKHSYPDAASVYNVRKNIEKSTGAILKEGINCDFAKQNVDLKVFDIPGSPIELDDTVFNYKKNRYSIAGETLCKTPAWFKIEGITFAELRDLNRHRTGFRCSSMIPTGFYTPPEIKSMASFPTFQADYKNLVKQLAESEDGLFYYATLLGTQYTYEHTTLLDKLIYEIELRSGMGAHFRYAQHYKAIYNLLIDSKPCLEPGIQLGKAEPE
jgi:hypothetical protein